MSAVWHKVLAAIDICNKVIQARDATLDKEVVSNLEIEIKLTQGCGGMGQKRTRMHNDTSTPDANLPEMTDTDDLPEEAYCRKTVFYVLIDNLMQD